MISNTLLTLTCLLAAVFILTPTHTDALCNVCFDNGIACVNETSFHLCFGNTLDTSKVYTCPDNRKCSRTSLRCVDSGNPTCEPNKGCAICNGDNLFTCTSRTTFAQCNKEKITNITGVCPEGLICDSRGGEICKDECNRHQEIECDRETPL